MDQTNFAVGETFPLPIAAKGDGGLFQVDANGAMFILKLSRTDAIAREAFRTGEIDLALALVDDILLLLYKIDGIFKSGWGDAPLAVHLVAKDKRPTAAALEKAMLHLYLVDSRLNILLALRQATPSPEFWSLLKEHALKSAENAEKKAFDFSRRLGNIYLKYSPDDLAKIAAVRLKLASTLPPPRNN